MSCIHFQTRLNYCKLGSGLKKTPLTNLCGYGASSNTVTCYPLLALFLPGGRGVSLIECKMRSLELSSLVHSICMQLHRLIAISLSLSLSTQHNIHNFVTKSVLLRFTCVLGVPFSAIHCDGFLFHDYEIIIGKYETPAYAWNFQC